MLNALDRRRLMQRMEDRSLVEKMIVARCAAGLGVLVLIAVIGSNGSAGLDAVASPAVQIPVRQAIANSAEVHRREVFEQRRQRYLAGRGQLTEATRPQEVSAAAPR